MCTDRTAATNLIQVETNSIVGDSAREPRESLNIGNQDQSLIQIQQDIEIFEKKSREAARARRKITKNSTPARNFRKK